MECQCRSEMLVLRHFYVDLKGGLSEEYLHHADHIYVIYHFTNNVQQSVSIYCIKDMRKVNT